MIIEVAKNEVNALKWLMLKGMEMTGSDRKFEIYERISDDLRTGRPLETIVIRLNQELITRVTQQLNDNHAVEAQDIRALLEAYKTLPKVVEFLREYYFGNMDLTELQKNDLVDLITELEQL